MRSVVRRCAVLARRGFSTRKESDTFGELDVPSAALYGAQTARSLINFPIGGPAARMPIPVIRAFGVLKKCAAQYNADAGKLDANVAGAALVQRPAAARSTGPRLARAGYPRVLLFSS